MADIRETIEVETDTAVRNVRDLQDATGDADRALDDLKSSADAAGDETVTIPVETPGATDAAADLDTVDQAARRAGSGAQVGTQHVSDLAGVFGPAGGAASEFGQAVEGAGGIVASFADKLGLSESATSKLMTGIGVLAVGVAAGAAAWEIYNGSQDRAKKGAQEVEDALGKVYDKLKEGDKQAAAQTFVDTMGGKIEKFQKLIGGGVTKADIAGTLFGDPASIRKVDTAVTDLDGNTRTLAEGGLKILKRAWDDAKKAADENTALESEVEGYFNAITASADAAAASINNYNAAWSRTPTTPAPRPAPTPTPNPRITAANVTNVTNVYAPPITPLAVTAAQQRTAQTQAGRYGIT